MNTKRAMLLFAVMLASWLSNGAQAAESPYKPVCPDVLDQQKITAYGFAAATLEALSFARKAVKAGTEGLQAATANSKNSFEFVTDVMAAIKTSSNYYECSRATMARFAVPAAGQNEQAAQLAALDYFAHIDINNRLMNFFKEHGLAADSETADTLSSLQVERGQRWADLVPCVTMAVLSLYDKDHPDSAGHVSRLIITNTQEKFLFAYAHDNFPELSNKSNPDSYSEPVKDAVLMLNGIASHTPSGE